VIQLVECLLSNCEALSSNPSTIIKKKILQILNRHVAMQNTILKHFLGEAQASGTSYVELKTGQKFSIIRRNLRIHGLIKGRR
jgi:hypothetical protein